MTICFSFVHSVETRDLISCLGKDGNLPTDEMSQQIEREVIYYDKNDKRTGNQELH